MTFIGGPRACLCVEQRLVEIISAADLVKLTRRGFKFAQLELSKRKGTMQGTLLI